MRKPKRRPSYAWARHLDASPVDYSELSDAAKVGLDYAQELADDAYERSLDPRRDDDLEPLTLQQLADGDEVDTAYVTHRIAQARRQLFGNLTDAAIYKRVQRQRDRRPRSCAEPRCPNTIPVTDPANRNYCDEHATGAARVARHRRKAKATPTPKEGAAR